MYEIFRRLCEERGLRPADVSRETGISPSSLSDWKRGKSILKADKLAAIAELFDVPVDVFTRPSRTSAVKIPVLGTVRGGLPQAAIQEILDEEEISPTLACTGDFYALRVTGDSMEPVFSPGDIAIVRMGNSIESGDIGIVLVGDEDSVIKQVQLHRVGISLISFNTAYAPRFFSVEEIRLLPVKILGRVVELRKKF